MNPSPKFDNNQTNRKYFLYTILVVGSLLITMLAVLNGIQSVSNLAQQQTSQIKEVQSQIENATQYIKV